MQKNLTLLLAALAASMVTLPAHAALTVDTAAITDANSAIATVGAAVFALVVGIKVWKWIRRVL